MARATILSVALLATTSCGGVVSVTGTGTGGGGTTGSSSGSTTTHPTTSSSSGNPGGSSVTLTMDPFTVAPGAEVYYCQNFANPFGSQDVQVQTFESHMSQGSHHLLLFYNSGVTANGPLEPCSGLEFAPTPYGSQVPDDALAFPPGVAALVPGTTGFRIQSHYLNTTQTTINAHVVVTLTTAAAGTVQHQAGVLFVVDLNFTIMPSSKALVTDDCALPFDMNIMGASSHMHQHGTNFLATIAGSDVYQTTAWSEPKPTVFDPPRAFHAGDPLHFACSFTNNGSTPLTFGESALTNEMCIFTAAFYPAPAPTVEAKGCVTGQIAQ